MFYKIKWINNRLNTLLAASIDLILILFYFYKANYSIQIFFIYSLSLWILGSYISGRYNREKNKTFEIIYKQLIKTLLVIFIYLIPLILYCYLFDENLITYSSKLDLGIFFLLSFTSQTIIKLTNKVKDHFNHSWVLISSIESYKSLQNHT